MRLAVLSHLYALFRQLNSSSWEDFGLGKLDMHFKTQTLDVQCASLHVPLLLLLLQPERTCIDKALCNQSKG